MICGGNQKFETEVINKLKAFFMLSTEEAEPFTYTDIKLMQDTDFWININQDSYINSISEIYLPKERLNEKCSPLTNEEKILNRSAVEQQNWMVGIFVSEASTKFKNATMFKIIRKVNNSKMTIKFPQLDLQSVPLQLFTDVIFNDLPNGEGQAMDKYFSLQVKTMKPAHYIRIHWS